jgi:phosphatidylserine/phosphatidylglycerophosphate/cardiolipin synthase-like enzyme
MNERYRTICNSLTCLAWWVLLVVSIGCSQPVPQTRAVILRDIDIQCGPPEGSVGAARQQAAPSITVHFSPKGGCTDAVVKHLDAAKKTILVQVYNFSSPPIADALIAAHKRGVDVRIIIDHVASTEKSCLLGECRKAGIPCWTDSRHKIAHNKIGIIDGKIVITGSFNWSEDAEKNAENLLVIDDAAIAKLYAANWEAHLEHSEKAK